jgi:hypothetical protein
MIVISSMLFNLSVFWMGIFLSATSLTLTFSDDDPTVFDANIAPSAETQRLTSAYTIEVFNVLHGLPCTIGFGRHLPYFRHSIPRLLQ